MIIIKGKKIFGEFLHPLLNYKKLTKRKKKGIPIIKKTTETQKENISLKIRKINMSHHRRYLLINYMCTML